METEHEPATACHARCDGGDPQALRFPSPWERKGFARFMGPSALHECSIARAAPGSAETASGAAGATASAAPASETPAALSTAQPQHPQAAVSAQLAPPQPHQLSSPGRLPQQHDVPPAQQQEAVPSAQHVLLTRRTLAELFLTRHQLQRLVPLELLLRELRGQRGVPHASPVIGAVVRVKAGGQHLLARVAAVSLAAGPASRGCGIELRLHVQPRVPQLGRGYILPAEVSSANSLAEGGLYEQAGRLERADFEGRLGCSSWDLGKTAMAACRLQVASTWAANLAAWVQEFGSERLEQHLAAPPQLQDMLSFLAEPAAPVVPAPLTAPPAAAPQAPASVASPDGQRLQPVGSSDAQQRLQLHQHQQQHPQPSSPTASQRLQNLQREAAGAQAAAEQPQKLPAAQVQTERQAAAALQQHVLPPRPAQQQQRPAGFAPTEQHIAQAFPAVHSLMQKLRGKAKPTLPQHLRPSCVNLFAKALAEADSPANLSHLGPRMQVLSGTKWTAQEAAGCRFLDFVRLAMRHSKITHKFKLKLYRPEGTDHWLLAIKRRSQQEPQGGQAGGQQPMAQQQQRPPQQPPAQQQQGPQQPLAQPQQPPQQQLPAHQPQPQPQRHMQPLPQQQAAAPKQQIAAPKRHADGPPEPAQQAQRPRQQGASSAVAAQPTSGVDASQADRTSGDGAAAKPGWFWHSMPAPCGASGPPCFSLLSPAGQPGSATCNPAQHTVLNPSPEGRSHGC